MKQASQHIGWIATTGSEIVNIRWENGEGHGCFLLICAFVLMYVYDLVLAMARVTVAREANHLKRFETVRKAKCTSQSDEDKIKKAIKGSEKDIDDAIRVIRSAGKYDRTVQFNHNLGLHIALIRDGINPCRIIVGCCAWEFWAISDLAGRKFTILAHALPIISSIVLLAFVYVKKTWTYRIPTADERFIFAVDSFMWAGLIFAAVSNHPLFFNDFSAKNLDMTESTFWLGVVTLISLILANGYFYSGTHAKARKCCVEFASGAEESSGDEEEVSRLEARSTETDSEDVESSCFGSPRPARDQHRACQAVA
jgi:hypothetical protein